MQQAGLEHHDELIQAAFGLVAGAYQREIDRRRLEQKPVKIFSVAGDAAAPAMPGGSVLVVTADPADDSFRAIVEAARSGSAARVSETVTRFEGALEALPSARTLVPLDPVAQLARIPLLARVSYRGHTLADAMVVGDGHTLSLARIPWAGAALDPEGFRADLFYANDARQPAESIVIVREPRLSTVERRVLEALPEDLSQIAFGRPGKVANWGLVAAAAVFVFAVGAGVYLAREAQREAQQDRQAAERQVERDVAGAERDAQQQQDQQQDQQERQDESGDLTRLLDEARLATRLESLDSQAAVTSLLQLRSQLINAGRIG